MVGNERKQISRCALDMLFLRVRGRLYQQVYQALHNAADAEDITQEAMVKAWMHLDTFRSDPRRDTESVLGAWLHRIALNVLRDFLRCRRRHATLSLDAMLEINEEGDILGPDFANRSQDPAKRFMESEWRGRLLGDGTIRWERRRLLLRLCNTEATTVLIVHRRSASLMNCRGG